MTSSTPPPPLFTPAARSLTLLIVVCACLFFIGLGRLPLLDPDEGRNAEVAREMLVTHDWITPHYDGLPYLDKPAVLFWMIAGSFRCFGISAWAARFPVALTALATVLLAWFMGRGMFDEKTGWLAGIILATSALFFGFARTVIFDMPLTFLVGAALLCFWLNRRRDSASRALDVAAFAAMGVGAITKGPVAFLLPLLTLFVYHALAGTLRELKKLHWGLGWIAFLVVALPWFIAVSLRNPDFPKYAFWEESLLRFTTGAKMHRSSGPFYYLPVYLAGFFPWSWFLLFAAWSRMKAWKSLRRESRRAGLFLISWAGVIFVFFTLSHSKLPGYFLPALIPLSILMGKVWRDALTEPSAHAGRWLAAGFALFALTGTALALLPEVSRVVLSAKAISRIPPSVMGLLPASLHRAGIILIVLALLGWLHARRARCGGMAWQCFAAAAMALPLLTVSMLQPLSSYARADSSRALARTLDESPERNLPVYGYYYFRAGLPFYLRRPVGLVTGDGDEMTSNYIASRFATFRGHPGDRITQSERQSPPLLTKGPLIGGKELETLFRASSHPFLLMARNENVADILSVQPRARPLWTGWQFTILRIPAAGKVARAHSGLARHFLPGVHLFRQ